MNRWLATAMNVAAYDVLWTAGMFGAGKSWWWAAPAGIVISWAVQLRFSPAPAREAGAVLAGAAAGASLDWLGASRGTFQYVSGSRAEFLVLFSSLWLNFGTTLRPTLRWMWRRPLLAAVLGAIGGPAAYWVGARIGAITLGEVKWGAFLWVAAQYGIVLPLWMLAARRVMGEQGGTGPRPTGPGATR